MSRVILSVAKHVLSARDAVQSHRDATQSGAEGNLPHHILREIREEGGIVAEIEGLLGIQNLSQEGWLGVVFLCQHVRGTPTPDGGVETDRAAYFSLADMDTLPEPFEPWCAWLVRRVLRGEHQAIPLESNNPYRPRTAYL